MSWSRDDVIALAQRMAAEARQDCLAAEERGDSNTADYWDGYEDALYTLTRHLKSGISASCFPAGSCGCHPLHFTT